MAINNAAVEQFLAWMSPLLLHRTSEGHTTMFLVAHNRARTKHKYIVFRAIPRGAALDTVLVVEWLVLLGLWGH